MMWTIAIAIAAVLAMGWLKGVADTIQHSAHYRTDGCKAKWKTQQGVVDHNGSAHHWWYLYGWLYNTEYNQREKFIFSSTLLVGLTDKWHLANFATYRITDIGIAVLLGNAWLLLWLPIVRWVGFNITYRK